MTTPTWDDKRREKACLDHIDELTRENTMLKSIAEIKVEEDGVLKLVRRIAELETAVCTSEQLRLGLAEEVERSHKREAELEAALRLAFNTVECASIDVATGEELPWYANARKLVSANSEVFYTTPGDYK